LAGLGEARQARRGAAALGETPKARLGLAGTGWAGYVRVGVAGHGSAGLSMAIYIPSVTEVISFCNSQAFNHVPVWRLEQAQIRGTHVHAAAAAHFLGIWYEPDPAHAGYLESLKTWADEFVAEVVFVEQELISLKYGFRGHPDALLRIRGDAGLTLVDWKTPKPLSLSWRLQLAGYRLLALDNGYAVSRVASLRLDADGGPAKFQGYTRTLIHDQNVFLGALGVFRFFNG